MLNSNSFLIRSKAAIVARGKNNKNEKAIAKQ